MLPACRHMSMRMVASRYTSCRVAAAQVFKQTSIFTVTSAAANNESLLACGTLGADEDDFQFSDPDGLQRASDGEQGCAWDYWSGEHDSDGALTRRQRDRCRTAHPSRRWLLKSSVALETDWCCYLRASICKFCSPLRRYACLTDECWCEAASDRTCA